MVRLFSNNAFGGMWSLIGISENTGQQTLRLTSEGIRELFIHHTHLPNSIHFDNSVLNVRLQHIGESNGVPADAGIIHLFDQETIGTS